MATDIICRNMFPYVCDKLWNKFKNAPTELKLFNGLKKIELEEKIANFSLSENTFNEEISSQSSARDDLRLVIIGKTGQGKSATANTILGKADSFVEDNTASSVTRELRRVTELVDGRKISVMDTPGLQDTHKSNKRILKELAQITTLFPDGVHAFVYVMNMADPRFTAEDKHVLDLIEKTFGGDFKNYCLLVYSHGDSALKDIDLDTYRKKQMAIGQATSGNLTQQYERQDSRGKEQEQEQEQEHEQKQEQDQEQEQKSLAKFIVELDWKMLAIDNKTSIPFEKAHYREQIVAMVDRMRKLNSPELYNNDMFFKAQQEGEALKQKGLKRGWDPSIMSKVETILAANPEISREQLQAEVREMQERQERELLQQQEFERQKKNQREESERQRLAAEEQEKRAKEIQLQKEEWEKQKQKDIEDFEMLQKSQKDMWEIKFRERLEQEKDMSRRREEEETRRMIQKEKEEAEIQERYRREQIKLENMLLKIKREDLEREIKRTEEEQERKKRQEEERKQFELRQTQEREKLLREIEEFERRRQEQLKREEREREMLENQRRWEKEQEEREQAERERRQREHTERLQREREEQVNEISDEYMRMRKIAINGVVTLAKTVVGWFT